jgi:hypothetical protein
LLFRLLACWPAGRFADGIDVVADGIDVGIFEVI